MVAHAQVRIEDGIGGAIESGGFNFPVSSIAALDELGAVIGICVGAFCCASRCSGDESFGRA